MKLEQHIPHWNKDGVWKNVAEKLQQKKKRRFLFWCLMGTASAVLFIGFLIGANHVEFINTSWNKNRMPKSEQKIKSVDIQNNIPSESPIALDNHSKLKAEPNLPPIKRSAKIERRLSTNNLKSTSAKIQEQELVSPATNLKSKRNTPLVVIPPNTLVEKIDVEPVVHKKFNALAALPIPPIDLLAINLNQRDSVSTKKFNLPLVQSNNKKKSSTVWWLENGLSIGKKSFTSLNERTINRNTTEEFRFIQTNAIGIQKFLNENWSLNIGFAYQIIYEKYEYAPSFIEEEQIFSEEATTYDLSNGMTYFEPGLATLRTTKTRHIIHNNFIHRLSLPVELAYNFKIKDWSLEPSLGFRFQYFQQFKGVIAQDGDHFFDHKAINETYYSNNISMGFITSLNLKYSICQRGSLGMRFTYERDDFLNLIKNDVFSRYETMGLQLGYYHLL